MPSQSPTLRVAHLLPNGSGEDPASGSTGSAVSLSCNSSCTRARASKCNYCFLPVINHPLNLPLHLQVAHLLPDGSEEDAASGSAGSAGVVELQQLLHKGEAIELQLDSVERLQALLQEHYAWELRLKQVMQGTASSQYLDHSVSRSETVPRSLIASFSTTSHLASRPAADGCLYHKRGLSCH